METYINETRPFEIIGHNENTSKMRRMKECVEYVLIPENVEVRYARYQYIDGVLLCYEFANDMMDKAIEFIKSQDNDPMIRGVKWFLGVMTGTDGKNEIIAYMPWNCTKYEMGLVAGTFVDGSLPTLIS